MRYKKIMLVALVLLAILTIGAVSASDGSDELAANEVGAGNSSIAEAPSYADEILGNTITDGGEPPVIGDEDDEFVDEGDDYEDDYTIEVWFNYEDNGNIYTDTPSEIVCISVPYGIDGTVYVDVNGEQEGSWKIEFYENYDSYYWWALSDLNITEEGNYTITVKLDDEILKEENLEVLEFNNETFRFVYDSMKETFSLYCPDGAEGTLTVTTVKDPEVNDEEIYHETFDVADYRGWSEWYLSDLEMKDDGILREFLFNITNTDDEEVISFYKRLSIYADEEDWNDADDGVIIDVFEDCDFELEGDLNKIFASVSVFNNLQGNITISVYDEDADEDLLYFNKNISEITESEDDGENENFTVYKIKLSDLNDFDDFKTQRMFTIAFSTEDGGVVDNRKYYIMYEDYGIIIFYMVDDDDDGDDDESYGEGKEIEVEFRDANVVTNDAIVIIPKENIPDDAADEFSAIVIYEEDEYSSVVLNLTVLDSDGENYYIYVNDLMLPEIGESVEVGIVLQFFNDVGEKVYYAQQYDNDYQSDVVIYTSPYIVDEAYLLSDDWVISFRQMPNVDDEFIVSVFFNGTYIIQKTFKQSDFIDDEDDDEAIYEIKLSDLGINETGIHVIEVNLTSDGSPFAYTYGVVDIDSFGIIPFEPENDEGLPVFMDVSDLVFTIRVTDDVSGFVRIYLNNTQVGQDIDLADLCFSNVPPFNGRLIYLNDFAVDKSGSCDFKVEVYDENGTLMRNMASLYDVEVTPNSVEFSDWGYGFEPDAFINFHLGTPIDRDAYFNIYLNGKKAGKYSIANGFEFLDGFVDQFYGGRILKPGHYDVNVTFFDGEKETDFDTGSFNVNLLNVTSDKKVYLYNVDDTIITFYFDIDTREGNQDRLDAYYIEDWGPVGADLNMIFNPFFTPAEDEDADISEVYDFSTNTGTFDAAWLKFGNYGYRLHMGTNYILVTFLEGWHGEPKVMWGGIVSFEVVDHISADPELTITAGDVDYGEDVTLSVNADESFVGYVTVQIAGSKYSVYVVNGTGSLKLSGLSAKTYDAIATYGGNGYYGAGEANTKFTVNKLNSTIALTGDIEFSFGQTGSTNVTYTNATGVNASVVGHPEAVVNVKGNAIEVSGLAAGDYTLTVTTIVDENHNPATATANINVFKMASSVAIDVGSSFNVGDEIVINVTSTADVTVVINNRAYEVKDGKVVINSSELGAGNFTVFATVEGSSANATFTINLIGTEIIVANETIDLYTLGYVEDAASLNPADAGDLIFVSSDENVVSIIYGVIFANSTGTATVTVSFAGNNKYAAAESKTITVNVRLKDASVSVENDTLELNVDDRYEINATTVPGFLSVEYASSDESVATVTDYGLVTAVGEGTAIITVTVGNDITYAVNSTNVTVKVSRLPSEIVTVKDSIDMKVNGEFGAPASLIPSDAGSLTYAISDETVVSIVNDTIVAVGAGKANVTYSFAGNYKYAAAESKTIQVTVEALDASVNVSKTSYKLNVGDDDTIVAVTVPAGLKVNFATDDDDVISVDSQGNIVALGVGNATVIVSVGDNRIYKYDSVVVDVSVTAKELSKTITEHNIKNYFDKNGRYVANLDEIIFSGVFNDLNKLIFHNSVSIKGQDALFRDTSFEILGDHVSVSNIAFKNEESLPAPILVRGDYAEMFGNKFDADVCISIENSRNFSIDSNEITCTQGYDVTGIDIKGSSSGVVQNNKIDLKSENTAYGINTDPLGQKLDVEYTHNTITAQSKYAVGIYDDSELIKDNEITLICDYGVGIVVLSDDTTVENNKVIVKASNEGSGDIPDENIAETSGIVVKASAKIINNVVESTAKSISVIEGSSTISDNQLTGSVSVSSDGNTLSGNTIVTDEKYAIDLGNSAGNTVSGNDLHAGDLQGSDAINSGNGSNSISGNDVKVDPKIVAKDATVQYSAGKYYSVTVYGDDGKVASGVEVTFTLNGKKVAASRTNANGVAQFKVTQTPVTNAKLVSSALGVSATAKLTVKHLVTLKTVKVKKSAKKLVLQATLAKLNGKYLKNKKVTFKFNGKKYTAKTNKKGVAKVTIKSSVLKKLKVGKKVTYQATYSKDTVKKTVKVKK